jgi:hypothetical protein
VDAVYNALKNASKEIGHFTVYRKEDILERWHYKNNRRAPPIFVLADESYAFDDMYQYVEGYEKLTNKTSKFLILYLSILLHVLEFHIQVLRLLCNVLSQLKFIRFKTS